MAPAKKDTSDKGKKKKNVESAQIQSKTKKELIQKDKDLYIVGIGASAGGLEAFEQFFRNMPADSGMAYILVPHLDPTHISLMPELIQKCSKMKVIQVKDGIVVEPNSVYIVPPNNELAIIDRSLQLFQPVKASIPRMPINYFFRSLAQDQAEKAICIILSGMGTDGTLGLRAIKGSLGMAIAQSPESAKYDSMPRSALETNLVDFTLPPEKMPEQLITYTKYASQKISPPLVLDQNELPDALQKIFILLRTHTGHDFSAYKRNTISRRIERRMNVHQIEKITAYVRYLRENTDEVQTLFNELLIGVTNFFRDEKAFEILKTKVMQQYIESKPKDSSIRAWIPGCSTGEEAYSVAIILRECMEKIKQHFGVQIFATDIDERSIDTARGAIYPSSISADVDPGRLKRFFDGDENIYQIKKDIREMLVFAIQNIIKDPPFTKLDLISCRNLLIYLDSDLQKKLLPIFHYSLKPGGLLFLGSSESIGGFSDLFAPINKKWKIYRRKESAAAARLIIDFPATQPLEKNTDIDIKKPVELNMAKLSEKALLQQYAPPSTLVGQDGEIFYIHGRTGKYLEPSPGDAKLNIFDMAREGLKMELPSLIRKAKSQKRAVYNGLKVKTNGDFQTINLIVSQIYRSKEDSPLYMIAFEDISISEPTDIKEKTGKTKISSKKVDEKIKTLEKELQHTKEGLQITIEELETANEELKSTNEELQSTNEELQSTNEELETSKEEQQSMNEELTTVNNELQGKIGELTDTSNDMKNLLDSIDIPTIFLDNDFCIKRFTIHATKVINLIHSDIGRPVNDIVTKLKHFDIAQEAQKVLSNLVFIEKDVQTKDSLWYKLKILPYRTIDNVIDGVVVTFEDITRGKQVEKELEERQAFLEAVFESTEDGIVACDENGILSYFNDAAHEFHGLPVKPIPPEEWVDHYNIYEADGKTPMKKENIPLFRALKGEKVLKQKCVIAPNELPDRLVSVTGRRLVDSRKNLLGAMVTMREIAKHE